jgi:myosin-1
MPTAGTGAAASRPVPKPAVGGGAARAPPPPPAPPAPPAAPARPAKQMYKALYNFAGQEGEVALVKGELVEVKEKDENGTYFLKFAGFKLTS